MIGWVHLLRFPAHRSLDLLEVHVCLLSPLNVLTSRLIHPEQRSPFRHSVPGQKQRRTSSCSDTLLVDGIMETTPATTRSTSAYPVAKWANHPCYIGFNVISYATNHMAVTGTSPAHLLCNWLRARERYTVRFTRFWRNTVVGGVFSTWIGQDSILLPCCVSIRDSNVGKNCFTTPVVPETTATVVSSTAVTTRSISELR